MALLLQIFIESPWSKSILTWELMEFLPADSGTEVDAIVVLGRGASGFLAVHVVAAARELE